MSDAPERIWLDGDATIDEGVFPRCFATPKPASDPPMEFVRGDIHAAAIARAERAEAVLAVAEEALRVIALSVLSLSAGADAENRRHAGFVLSKIAELKGGAQ